MALIKFLKSIFKKIGCSVTLLKDESNSHLDLLNDTDFLKIYNFVRPYTMTSIERIFALYQSVKYILHKNIEGDFVECGVWRGGSSMVVALTCKLVGDTSRKIYLYDTYEGMSEPTEHDEDLSGTKAKKLLTEKNRVANVADIWCYSTLDDVRNNLSKTAFPLENLIFVKGKVEDTIPAYLPNKISILRLDTDWYESTTHELKYLYPMLSTAGILILDDYGHWQGARKAVDEYFSTNGINILLNRIDYTGRIAIKN